ncbi:MAG: hypothetical protein L0H15_08505 [Nitrosospira sp.]|nr:hypothetical protein [Nitrosospira sp.]
MNSVPSRKSIISLALGSAFAAMLGTAPVASAVESPFTTQSLNKGYMVAEAHYGDKKEGYGGMKNQDKKYGEGRSGDRSGHGDPSQKTDYEARAGIGEDHYQYGTRASDRKLQHMRPMGE